MMVSARKNRLLSVICVLLAALRCGIAVAGGGAPADPKGLVAAGEAALAAFDLDGALAAFRGAREAAPGSYEPAWRLAQTLIFRAMLATDPRESSRLDDEAAALARDAIRIDPGGISGHLMLAVAAGRLSDRSRGCRRVELARESWSEATTSLRADPRSDLAHHVLGVWNREVAEAGALALFVGGLFCEPLPAASLQAAANHLRRAVELRPASVAHRIELGLTLAATGKLDEARQEIERGLALPESAVIDSYYRELAKRELARIDHRVGGQTPP